ncbi:hypothetical protein SteCoe_2421 [Stentor coeruleus]|uniref:Uncharacterized protein n=1 Tax=Stentor coeruleus TaxID=5963 RepID=A0A1R2CZD7_9CILI|nr:hypothetical protein SteCoe_2421 [Stentor coeruleus]
MKGKKTLSITLKIPSFEAKPIKSPIRKRPREDIARNLSVYQKPIKKPIRDEFRNKTLHHTSIFFTGKSPSGTVPYCFSPIKSRYSPLPQKPSRFTNKLPSIPSFILNSIIKTDTSKSFDNTMFEHLIGFSKFVKEKYSALYNEIDRLQKGFFDIDDLIDFFILKQFGDSERNYESIRDKAKEILLVFMVVSNGKRVYQRHFLALCSVFEFSYNKSLDLVNSEYVIKIKDNLQELKELFEFYGDSKHLDLNCILTDTKIKDKYIRSRALVESEKVDFPRFLRFLPFFAWALNEGKAKS